MKKLLPLLLLCSSVSYADGSFFKYGLGLPPGNEKPGNIKIFSLGYQDKLISVFDYQLEGGLFTDSKTAENRGSSAFTNTSIGLSIVDDNWYTKAFWGVAGITNPDSMLGSNFQFNHDLELGLKDKRGVAIGLGYKHISNAGFVLPNRGRDFLFIKLQIPY